MRSTTRCGLGQTSSNPVITTLKAFRSEYESRITKDEYSTGFDLSKAVEDSCKAAGRRPNLEV